MEQHKEQYHEQELEHDAKFYLPAEFLDGINSGLTSPVESATESDEEDYLNDLSKQLAQSTLEDQSQSQSQFQFHHSKSTGAMAGSPQSTLCGWNHVSSRGSSNCTSPAQPVVSQVTPPWDVLTAAAGEVARQRMTENNNNINNMKVSNRSHQFNQIQAAAQLKKQQMMKQQLLQQQQYQYQQLVQQRKNGVPLSTWPTVKQAQQLPGSGMRAVFLGNNNNVKRESSGTGVFLPRQVGAPSETRKRGCSTVLLPDRVIHALNLNLETQTRSNGGLPHHDYDAELSYPNSAFMAEQRRQQLEKDLRLPQEWTY